MSPDDDLDAVGGPLLPVNADCRRDGPMFLPLLHGRRKPEARTRKNRSLSTEEGEVATEGSGNLAFDLLLQRWARPLPAVGHRNP